MQDGAVVLLVEDEPLIATMLTNMLEEEGYRVTCHTTAEEAARCIESGGQRFDALITDVDLKSEISGFDIAALLREHQSPVATIFMSGELAATVQAQVPDHAIILEKPFRPVEIADALERLLGEPASS